MNRRTGRVEKWILCMLFDEQTLSRRDIRRRYYSNKTKNNADSCIAQTVRNMIEKSWVVSVRLPYRSTYDLQLTDAGKRKAELLTAAQNKPPSIKTAQTTDF